MYAQSGREGEGGRERGREGDGERDWERVCGKERENVCVKE